ncbi:Asp-tRNA(Asn)/Glu-tRNA(Gln) amidotransferase subunit GatA [bacterium]|nr:Asp-tRNA(Asn)/Glu-tRNA(Gln) amidotransferase subunit GatA [bacterium]MBU1920465.1 Asp-tRNA(Asn)/Glu-tRNA(Gln) amidotransferase subunit GatA [bacterium]
MSIPLPSPEHLRQNPIQLTKAVSDALKQARDGEHLRAFITLLDDRALVSAENVCARLQAGEKLPLAGWILAVKDNIAIRDTRLTCGSKILGDHQATFTATAVKRLEAAGAVIIGKTNLDQFAMGSSSEMSYYGEVRNPHDLDRVPGGSSGGSAVAVAAGFCHAALGSETGGSVRQPAAFCGIAGLKPTYGRVSRYGLVAFGSSLDQISFFGRDCASILSILSVAAGVDPRDSTSAPEPVADCSKGLLPLHRKLRIGIPAEYFQTEGMDESIVSATRNSAEELKALGHSLVDVSLPTTAHAIPVYYVLAVAEASSNLARFDGARYGWRNPQANSVADVYNLTRGEGFGDEVRRRIMMGTYVLSAGYHDAYYKKAQRVRRLIFEEFLSVFKQVDVLLAPTTPTTAFKIGEKIDDPVAMYLSDIFTVPANLAGIPAVSVPIGCDERGMPIGAQIMGPHFSEELILQVASQLEERIEVAS